MLLLEASSCFSKSLVLFDLNLKLFNLGLKTGEVLLVFFTSVTSFLDLAFELANILLAFRCLSLFGIKFRFEFAHATFKFLNSLLATLQGNLFGIIKSLLEILQLIFHVLLQSSHVAALILFLLEFFTHDGSIIDSLLCLFFGVLGFLDSFIDFISDGDEFLFHLSLLVGKSGVLRVEKVGTFVSFHQFLLSHLAALVGLFNGNTEFVDFGLEKVLSSFGNSALSINSCSAIL